MNGQPHIVVEAVSHHYRPPVGRAVLALESVSLEVRERDFVALLGPSGCGKSTLLYLIGGFLPTETGKILVEGKPVAGPGPDRGIVFQNFALFPWKTVLKNVLYGLERQAMPREEREARAQAFIDLVGLSGFEQSYPSQLSGGMKQRTAIARALAFDPRTLLMDEPFGALDAQTRSLMQSELLAIWEKTRKTVIFVTHDVEEAVFLAERVAVMSARPGRIKTVIDTRFAKRDRGVRRTKPFMDKVEELWSLVREEALKALQGTHPRSADALRAAHHFGGRLGDGVAARPGVVDDVAVAQRRSAGLDRSGQLGRSDSQRLRLALPHRQRPCARNRGGRRTRHLHGKLASP